LDCDDANSIYTVTCQQLGYSGLIFFVSTQWQIEIHSKRDACLARWIVRGTDSHFVPQNATWMNADVDEEAEDDDALQFAYECVAKMEVANTADGLATVQTDALTDQVWFWLTLVLCALICALLCVAVWCYSKHRRNSSHDVVGHDAARGGGRALSRQDLELTQMPHAAFGSSAGGGAAGARDDNIAPASQQAVQLQYAGDDGADNDEGDDDEEDEDDDAPDLDIENGEPEMVVSAGGGGTAQAGMAAVSTSPTVSDDIELDVDAGLIQSAFDREEEKVDVDGDDDDPALDFIAGTGAVAEPGANNDDIEDLDI